MPKTADNADETGPALLDAHIAAIDGWRGETLGRVRALIREADPDVVEAIKWRKPTNPAGVAAWEHDGLVCTGEIYKACVKLTFAHGAALPDPASLFNAGFGGNTRRAIDLHEGETVDAQAFMTLVRTAVAFNVEKKRPGRKK